MLRRVFRDKKGKVQEEMRIFHKEELRELYRSSATVKAVKSKRL